MKKVLIGNHYPQNIYEIVKNRVPPNFEVQMLNEATQDNLRSMIRDVDYLIASGRISIDDTVIPYAKKLKMIQRTGVGLDCIDLQCLKEHHIPLYVNQGINAVSVAEHTILLMLASIRNLIQIDKKTKNGIWEKQSQGVQTYELKNKKIGLIGLGSIGRAVAQRLQGFQTSVFYYTRSRLERQEEIELGIEYRDLDEIIEQSDIISFHCPLTQKTKQMIGEKEIDNMKHGVVIINTARGGILDQKALIAALKTKRIKMVALDVYENEPLPDNSELKGLENVILTPHIGGITYDSFEMMMIKAMSNIELFEKGEMERIQLSRVEI